MKLQYLTLVFFIFLVLVSCRGGGGDDVSLDSPSETNSLHSPPPLDPGPKTYLAVLETLNENVSGVISGALTVAIKEDFLVGDVRISGSAPQIIHAQNIHLGDSCPTEENDLNQDGYIDVIEVYKHSGSVIVPLDGDLNTQYGENGVYPVADPWGSYIYSETASFTKLITDLYSSDEHEYDSTVKLAADDEFNFEGGVVIIHGVANDVALPETVESINLLSNQQTLPIACGILKLVAKTPGIKEENDRTVGRLRVPDNNPSSGRQNPRVPRKPAPNSRPEENKPSQGDKQPDPRDN